MTFAILNSGLSKRWGRAQQLLDVDAKGEHDARLKNDIGTLMAIQLTDAEIINLLSESKTEIAKVAVLATAASVEMAVKVKEFDGLKNALKESLSKMHGSSSRI